MSLPKQIHTVTHVPSYSSSPSKSSLRSQKSGQQQPRSLLPSPHFEDDPAVHVSEREPPLEQDEEAEGKSAQAVEADHEDEAPHNLQPFFTLLNDTQTSEHYHPAVHYIFADDDPDIITEAALQSLSPEDVTEDDDQSELNVHPNIKNHYLLIDVARTSITTSTQSTDPNRYPSNSSSDATARPPPHRLYTTNKYPYHITSASSLSPSFAILSAEITSAPTFESPVATTSTAAAAAKRRSGSIIGTDGGAGGGQTQTQGLGIYNTLAGVGATGGNTETPVIRDENIPLMLKIQGMSAFDNDDDNNTLEHRPSNRTKSKSKSKSNKGKANEDPSDPSEPHQEEETPLEELVRRFEDRLRETKAVIDAGTGIGIGIGSEYDVHPPRPTGLLPEEEKEEGRGEAEELQHEEQARKQEQQQGFEQEGEGEGGDTNTEKEEDRVIEDQKDQE